MDEGPWTRAILRMSKHRSIKRPRHIKEIMTDNVTVGLYSTYSWIQNGLFCLIEFKGSLRNEWNLESLNQLSTEKLTGVIPLIPT